uniref:27.3 kDa rubber elongation factor n=1 Tax=Hevea brasiliensis TaxID=3981 RepID=A0A0S2UQ52_HEVBR|nr:27.3 kDa rubber elongation factor [Hevea brasiliensis]AMO43676.1 rubber elongation factor 258 [Hevea brasiliensis]
MASLLGAASNVINAASNVVEEAVKGVENAQQEVANAVSNPSNIVKDVASAATDIVEEAAKGVENVQKEVANAVSNSSNIVKDVASAATDIVEEAAKVVDNVQQGVVSAASNVVEEAAKGVGNIQEKVDDEEEDTLKYLDIVQAALVLALVSSSKLYLFVKDKSGPLKPGVDTAEVTIKSVVRPFYYRFHDVPNKVLKFADNQVDASVTLVLRYAPPVVKQVSTRAYSVARNAPRAALALVSYLPLPTNRLCKLLSEDK